MNKKRFGSSLCLFWLFILAGTVLGLGIVHSNGGYAQNLPETALNSFNCVDNILPSRPGDTFVQLKNGLTLLIRKSRKSPVVSCQVFVHTGSIYEDKYFFGGISHYLEHVVAGGSTKDFTEKEAQKKIQEIGGASNAYTSYNKTVYYISTTSSHYAEALKLLMSYVTRCAFNPVEVEREKGVIQQEFKLGENNPNRLLWQLFLKTAYRVNPIRHPVIGYEKVFVTLTRNDLIDYYRERYVPNNMVVVVVGNVEPGEVIKEVWSLSRDFTRRTFKPIVIPREPRQIGPRKAEKTSPMVRLSKVVIGFPSVRLTHPDLYPLDVLAMILGQGRSSRLYKKLKDEKDLVLAVGASNWTPNFARGIFVIDMTLPEQNIKESLDVIRKTIEELKRKPISEKELKKAKRQVVASKIFSQESVESMASSLASSYLETGDPYFDDEYVKGIEKVKKKDVQKVAAKYLNFDVVSIVTLKPEKKVGKEIKKAIVNKIQKAHYDTVEKVVLHNGLTLLLKENHEVPVCTIQLYGKGGQCYEPPEYPGISNFTFSLLTKGTKTRTKEQIAQEIEGMGASLSSGSGRNTYYVSSSALSEDFDRAMELFADVVRHPSFPREEIEKQRKDVLLAIKKLDENWQTEIIRLFKRHYFHKHPYKNDLLGTERSIESLTRHDIVNFYRSLVMPNNAVIAVFGDINREKVLKSIKKYFGDWPRGTLPEISLPDETSPLKKNETFKKTNEKISAAVFLGTNGTTIYSEDKPALDVIDAVISGIGYPSGWLQDALRGGKHNLVYVVHAFPFYGIKAGYFGVICQTTMNNLDKVLKIINENLDKISSKPIGKDELQRGKDMVITMRQMGLETNEDQAQDAALNEVLGLGYNYGKVYLEKVKKVTAKEVLRVARKYFKNRLTVMTIPEHPVETIIPPEMKTGSDIRH